ncbi:hypothetical protein LCGC14_2246100, partial [marine sediment metagenome]
MIVKLSGTAIVAFSLLAILSTGCATPTYEPVVYNSPPVLTEEGWNALLADSSALADSAPQD